MLSDVGPKAAIAPAARKGTSVNECMAKKKREMVRDKDDVVVVVDTMMNDGRRE
jgi:urease gamma subunit